MTKAPKPDCKLEPRYNGDGGLMDGDCACGKKKLYSYSTDPKDKDKALEYMVKQWRAHYTERYGPMKV